MPAHPSDDRPPNSAPGDAAPTVAPSGSAAPDAHSDRPGDAIGPYTLISPLGEGGFGTVWLAERRQPFVQQVALKIIKAGMDSKAVVARFEQERQALAVMNHAGIAKVLDGGLTPRGRPYFAMEYVKGEPITSFCDGRRMPVPERLRLFRQVCEAVQHAHTKGIIHRDLKPSNVLVSLGSDDRPSAKVIDFGIAKAVSGRMTEQTLFTETGQMIGTPEYMSPEQAEPGAVDIDTRTDVYSLGVILYELLAGMLPFDPHGLRSKAYREIQRVIREEDPPAPSARLSTIATKDAEVATRIGQARKEAVGALSQRLKRELEWIPLKAMRKERGERYGSAADLGKDVENYLKGNPLVAAPESTAYRVRKYVRRNRGFVTAAVTVLGALIIGLGAATWQRSEAIASEARALANERRAIAEKSEADRARAEAMAARDVAQINEREAEKQRDAAEMQRIRSSNLLGVITTDSLIDAVNISDYNRVRRELATLVEIGHADRFAVRLALAASDRSTVGPLAGHDGRITGIAFGTDGTTLANVGLGRKIHRRDVLTGRYLGFLGIGGKAPNSRLFISPDGKQVAGEAEDFSIRLWDASTAEPAPESLRGLADSAVRVVFSPDGKTIAARSWAGTVQVWNTEAGIPVGGPLAVLGNILSEFAVNRDGTMVAVAPDDMGDVPDRSIHLRHPASGKAVGEPLVGHEDVVTGLVFSPDGTTLASASADGTVRIWTAAEDRKTAAVLRGHVGGVFSIAFSPDGSRMASGGRDRTIRLWDPATGEEIGEPFRGHEQVIRSLAFSPDGSMVASLDADQDIRLWSLSEAVSILQECPGHDTSVTRLSFNPDGTILASASDGPWQYVTSAPSTIRLWDVLTGRPLGVPLYGHEAGVTGIAFSPDGTRLASADRDGTIRLWDVPFGAPIGTIAKVQRAGIRDILFDPEGRTIVASGDDGIIRRFDASTGTLVGEPLSAHEATDNRVEFSPDGRILATAGEDRAIRLWDGVTLKAACAPLLGHQGGISAIAFSPDGKVLASGGMDGTIHLWDVATGRSLGDPLRGQGMQVDDLAFSGDGETLVTTAGSALQLWDVATGRPIGMPLEVRAGVARAVAFSPDGRSLASGTDAGTIQVWRTVPVRERFGAILARLKEVQVVRERLGAALDAVEADESRWAEFQESLRTDPRIREGGEIAALLAFGEATAGHAAAVSSRVDAIIDAAAHGRWMDALSLWDSDVAHRARVGSPVRDLLMLVNGSLDDLPKAERMKVMGVLVEVSEMALAKCDRGEADALATRARVHWEMGEKPQAIAVQREAIERNGRGRSDVVPQSVLDPRFQARLRSYEELPAGADLPSDQPPDDAGDLPAPTVAPG